MSDKLKTCAIILAAGQSRRMGAPKLLLPINGLPLICRVVDAMQIPLIDAVLVVGHPHQPQIRAALGPRRVQWVENPDSTGEMLSSVRCGLRALPKGTQTVVVTPADLPGLTPDLVRGLLDACQARGASIMVPVHQGRRGHPLVFSSKFKTEILSAFDGIGLRGLLQAHADEVCEWPAGTAAIWQDLDTPEDYRRYP